MKTPGYSDVKVMDRPKEIHIILHEKKASPEMVFVEIEDENGYSIGIGKSYKKDGYYCVKITKDDFK